MSEPRTLASLLRTRADGPMAALPALHLFKSGGWHTWSWAAYWRHVQTTAAGLRAAGIRPGDHVVVVAVDIESAVRTILGAWAIGAVPTPIGGSFRASDIASHAAYIDECAAIVDGDALVVPAEMAALVGRDGATRRVLVAEQLSGHPDDLTDPDDVGEVALIQLTSGTTGRQRGVVVSHAHLRAHLAAMAAALPLRRGAVGVSWLPLYHDMGLVGGLLFPLHCGFELRLSSPSAFRSNPFGWLETLSKFGATITAAPPSVWTLCIRLAARAAERGLDLSRLDCALVGAEPISGRTMREFADAFAPCGFAPEAFFPVYGLAEATLSVTFPALRTSRRFDRVSACRLASGDAEPATDPEPAATFVGVGRPIPGVRVRIVDRQGADLPERRIGRILVRSEHGMTSYYRGPAVDDWIDTGDLGYRADGDLFVTGREKELIIRAGAKLVPAFIEEVVERVDGVRAGRTAAIGVWSEPHATELAWVVAETRRPHAEHAMLARAVRDALEAHGVNIDGVRFVAPDTLPKTTSGKLMRARVSELVREG
jgi:acyl-CoA synthetase (AMP-forming)/AMP-acid ligase II